MPFLPCSCFLFPLTEHADVKARDRYFDENGEFDTAQHAHVNLHPKSKSPIGEKENNTIMADNSIAGTCYKELEVQLDYTANSIQRSCSESSIEITGNEKSNQLDSFTGIVNIEIVGTDKKSYCNKCCSCSNKTYSDCGTQTDDKISAKNDLSKNNKFAKKYLSWINQKFRNIEHRPNSKKSNIKFRFFFKKKCAKKLVINDKIVEIRRNDCEEHADACSEKDTCIKSNSNRASKPVHSYDSANRHCETSFRDSSLTSETISSSIFELEKQTYNSNDLSHIPTADVHSAKANLKQRSKSDSDSLTIDSELRLTNHAVNFDSVFLNNHTAMRNRIKSLNEVEEYKQFHLPVGTEVCNDKTSEINQDNVLLIESELRDNFIHRKDFLEQNSIKNINTYNNTDEVIFCFNDSDILDNQSELYRSDLDEVFIRSRREDKCLDNGMEITNLINGSNLSMNSILSKNYFQSEEYIHKAPPPSPENVRYEVSFINLGTELLRDNHKIENPEEKLSKTFDDKHSQRNSEIRSYLNDENPGLRDFHPVPGYGIHYQPQTSKRSPSYSETLDIQTNCENNIIRSDSKGSSGYDSMDQDLRPFPKKYLRINSQNEVPRIDTKSKSYSAAMEDLKPELKTEFTSSQPTPSNIYSQRNCSRDLQTNLDCPYRKELENKSYDLNEKRNKDFYAEVYPSYEDIARSSRTRSETSNCKRTSIKETLNFNSINRRSLKSSNEYFCTKTLRPQQHTINNISIMKPLSKFSTENSAIQRVGTEENFRTFKPENTAYKQLVPSGYADNYEYPEKGYQTPNLNSAVYCSCNSRKSSIRKKSPVSNANESNYNTIYKLYDYIDGPLARTSKPIRKPPIGADK